MEEADRARLHSTSGGSSDTELNELAVRPSNSPLGERAVTMVTPVANMPSALRNSGTENFGGRAVVARGTVSNTGEGGNSGMAGTARDYGPHAGRVPVKRHHDVRALYLAEVASGMP